MYCIVRKLDNNRIDQNLIPKVKTSKGENLISGPALHAALVDRTKTKDRWWTCDPDKMMVFKSKDAAERACQRLKYGNPRVVKQEKAVKLATHWVWKVHKNGLTEQLAFKESLWHDDDWNEGENAD